MIVYHSHLNEKNTVSVRFGLANESLQSYKACRGTETMEVFLAASLVSQLCELRQAVARSSERGILKVDYMVLLLLFHLLN